VNWSELFQRLAPRYSKQIALRRTREEDVLYLTTDGLIAAPPPQDHIRASIYVTLYLDMLGWGADLVSADTPWQATNVDDSAIPEALDVALWPMLAKYEIVRSVLEHTVDCGTTLMLPPRLPSLRLADIAVLVAVTRRAAFVYQRFSDSFTVSLECRPHRRFEHTPDLARLSGFLQSVSAAFLMIVAAGIPIRGAIELGLGVLRPSAPRKERELIGPTIVDAYNLERQVAQYPRIVIGQNLLEFLSSERAKAPSGAHGWIHRHLLADIGTFLRVEPDGTTSLDYLNVEQLSQSPKESFPYLDSARRFVSDSHNRATEAGDGKLAHRYAAMQRYYDERISPDLFEELAARAAGDLGTRQKRGRDR
jgi:hypothetical protein